MSGSGTLVRELARVWNARLADEIDALFAPDASFEDMAFGVTREGIEEIRAMFRETWNGIPDLHTELERVVADEEWAASEWTLTGTHDGDFPDLPATGRSFSVRGVSFTRAEDGRIREQRDYYDRAAFLEQLGLLPSA